MSTHYDLFCKDCNEGAGLHWKDGADKLQAFLNAGGLTAGSRLQKAGKASGVGIAWEYGPQGGFNDILPFCIKHGGHNVLVRNEYGDETQAPAAAGLYEMHPVLRNWKRGMPSRALVAFDGATDERGNIQGVLLFYIGEGIQIEIDNVGTDLVDLGLDNGCPGAGIWLWEGDLVNGGSYSADDPDIYLDGTYRKPTPEEWKAINAGDTPWDVKDWFVNGE